MTQLRRDPIRGHWTIIAPGRNRRPDEYDVKMVEPSQEGPCPFCPGNEGDTPAEIDSVRPTPSAPDEPGWVVRLIPNQYPALSLEDDGMPVQAVSELHRTLPGIGVQEIVVATPDHGRRAANFSIDHWDAVLAASQYRMERLARDRRIKHVLLFQNHGAQGGASRSHAHFQIMGLPMTPSAVSHKLISSRNYFERNERCLFCDVLSRELQEGDRIVIEDEAFVAFAPWASRLAFELCVVPRPHHASFLKIPPTQRRRLASHMRDVLRRLEKIFGDFPYNWILHTAPIHDADPRIFHWHVEILPRLGRLGGYEWGTGSFVNTTSPEAAAEDLRSAAGD
ncbi:galactose-1-phosphate uridylyltransferase [Myxococcota bacterium]